MQTKRSTALLCLLMACTHLALSQTNYQPGSITLPGGERREGLIDYKQWTRNPYSIRFKANAQANPENYSPLQIVQFEVNGKERYEAAIVQKDMKTLNPEEVETNLAVPLVTDTVFLRVLYQGRLFNLYNFRDEKNRFYIKDSANGYYELSYRRFIAQNNIGQDFMQNQQLYKNQLMQYATDFDQLEAVRRAAAKTRYEENSLIKFARLAHNDDSKTEGQRRLYGFVTAGVNAANFTLREHPFIAGMEFKNSVSPVLGAGVDLFNRRQRGLFFFRLEAQYYQMKLDGSLFRTGLTFENKDFRYTGSMRTIAPVFSPFVTVYNRGKLRVFAGPSAAFNFTTYQDDKLTERTIFGPGSESTTTTQNYLLLSRSWTSIHLRAGAILGNKWQADLSSLVWGDFNDVLTTVFKPGILQARVGYRF